jgi:putative sterol carrier protein
MPHPFLSDEWIEAAREIRARHANDDREMATRITMNQIVTEVPFGEGTIESYVDTTDGALVLELGQLDAADVTITTDYDTARAIFVDQNFEVAMQAFMTGRIRVQGDMMKLLGLQAALPADDTAKELAEEIRAITS